MYPPYRTRTFCMDRLRIRREMVNCKKKFLIQDHVEFLLGKNIQFHNMTDERVSACLFDNSS